MEPFTVLEDKIIFASMRLNRIWATGLFTIFFVGTLTCLSAAVEVRRVGLSRAGDHTLLTVVLDQAAEPLVTPRTALGKPQLVIDFPQARASRLPNRLAGDDLLVEWVFTEVTRDGVRITLQLFPERPYTFWKKIQRAGGQTLWQLGLNPDAAAPRADRPRPPEPYGAPPIPKGREPGPEFAPPGMDDYGQKETRGGGAPGSFGELKNLMPAAGTVLTGLEAEGWTIAEFHSYDRPGQRLSRDFLLTHRQFPQLVVKIVYLPANMPNTPNINMITLTTERLGGETAVKYQEMRKWNFSKIKQSYEDIGDFFDEALKPLRVKLREETKALALRDAKVFQNFIQRATRNPQVADKAMNYIRDKVNQRFEGLQYTVSENPLMILNLVDFLYVRVYFLEPR